MLRFEENRWVFSDETTQNRLHSPTPHLLSAGPGTLLTPATDGEGVWGDPGCCAGSIIASAVGPARPYFGLMSDVCCNNQAGVTLPGDSTQEAWARAWTQDLQG